MTRQQLRESVEQVFQEALDLHAGKNRGYAYEDDGLSNFKKASARSRQTPLQYLWTLNSKQILAVEEAIFDGKEVTYEKVEDKLLDNIVYSAIALSMLRAPIEKVTITPVDEGTTTQEVFDELSKKLDEDVELTKEEKINAINKIYSKLGDFFSKESSSEGSNE